MDLSRILDMDFAIRVFMYTYVRTYTWIYLIYICRYICGYIGMVHWQIVDCELKKKPRSIKTEAAAQRISKNSPGFPQKFGQKKSHSSSNVVPRHREKAKSCSF